MNKLTRKETELIRELAKSLPKTFYEANDKVRMSGADIMKDKNIDVSKFEGKIKPEGLYLVNVPKKYPVNHSNRLMTAFENGGLKAVDDYARGVMDLVEAQLSNPHTKIEC